VLDLVIGAFRWSHFAAGVAWIGMLYFFNWVNAHFVAKLDAPTKQKVVPELMPRALYWFRWGAAVTWLTGLLLLFAIYYHGRDNVLLASGTDPVLLASLTKPNGAPTPAAWLPGFIALLVGFALYDVLFKFMKSSSQQILGGVLWAVIVIGMGCMLDTTFHYSGRAVFIHMGAILGTAMAANVWMRIWPAQRRIITAIKAGTPPDAKDVFSAGSRSRHNTYMSMSLLFLMVSQHTPTLIGGNPWSWQACVAVVFAIGSLTTFLLYKRSAKVQGF
jgi:uncharacterized membrane protein